MTNESSSNKQIIVGVADMAVSNDVAVDLVADLVTHSLGSCLGIAIHDPVAHIGGLLHLMLPDSSIDPEKAKRSPCMFADTGVPLLFHSAYRLGAEKTRITVKIAGGAEVLSKDHFFNIGRRNHEAVLEILTRNGVRISAAAVGGHTSRTIRLNIRSGQLVVRSPLRPEIIL